MTEIEEQIKKIVAEYTSEDLSQLTNTQELSEVGIDSLALVEIIFDIEEAFDISIPDEQELDNRAFSLKHIDDVTHLVTTLVQEKQSQ